MWLNGIDPRGLRSFANKNTHIEEGNNNNHSEEPQISGDAFDRDSLEQQSIESPIHEGFPPISQVVPYPVDIQETPIQV